MIVEYINACVDIGERKEKDPLSTTIDPSSKRPVEELDRRMFLKSAEPRSISRVPCHVP